MGDEKVETEFNRRLMQKIGELTTENLHLRVLYEQQKARADAAENDQNAEQLPATFLR